MSLKLNLDLHANFSETNTSSHLTSEQRFAAVLRAFEQKSFGEGQSSLSSSSSSTTASAIERHAGKLERQLQLGTTRASKSLRATVAETVKKDVRDVTWQGGAGGSVTRILAQPGTPVVFGTPLYEAEVPEDLKGSVMDVMSNLESQIESELPDENEVDEETGYIANLYQAPLDEDGDDGDAYKLAEDENMYQMPEEDGSPILYGSQNRSLYVEENSTLEDSVVSTRGRRRAQTAAIKRVVVTWNHAEGGVVCENLGVLDRIMRQSQVVLRVDCSLKAQQRAHLAAADKVAHMASEISELRDGGINSRFQKLADQLATSIKTGTFSNVPETLQCCNELERVVRDFYETARTYGRVIINEMHLPVEAKTVRPLKLGGVLGGHKYVVRGVLFKIPDGGMFSAYPDPLHIANKVQGHELKGLRSYFGWFFNRGSLSVCSFPLMAVIDFKGHRITAMTQLPIKGSETLIYGSDDAGTECTVFNKIPSWSSFIREASMGLNLKPHWAVNGRSKGGEIEIASCVDLEGHSGSDGRMYLTSRISSANSPWAGRIATKCAPSITPADGM